MHLTISLVEPEPDLNDGSTTFAAVPSRQFFHACTILDHKKFQSEFLHSWLKMKNLEGIRAYKTQEVLHVLPATEFVVFAPTDDFKDQNSVAEDVGFDGELAVYYVFGRHVSTAM